MTTDVISHINHIQYWCKTTTK